MTRFTTARHRQLSLATALDRPAGSDRVGLRSRRNQHIYCQAHGIDGDDRRQVAQAVSSTGSGRAARRAAFWPAPHLRGRQGGRGNQPGPADQASRWQPPLERPDLGCSDGDLQNHGASLATELLSPFAPPEIPPLRGRLTSTRSPPTRSLSREDVDPGPGSNASAATHGPGLRGRRHPRRIRHGTTTLFAALDVATGDVITQCRPRHRHQEFLGFLRQTEKSVPEDLDVP